MKYFSTEFQEFFIELASNNHKDWFDENRERYHRYVKKPFEVFVDDLIEEAGKIDPSINIRHKDAIFRINRDIRFSDKPPYKLNRAALISPTGKKPKEYPGFYVHLEVEDILLGGGIYWAKAEVINKIRSLICNREDEFLKIINEPGFKKLYGEIKGKKNKRIPKEFREKAEELPVLYQKQFIISAAYEDEELVTSPDLMDLVMEHFKAAYPFIKFLQKTWNK